MELMYSRTIDRPATDVFRFVGTDHVLNHPRWDPSLELEQLTGGPIGVGTIIRRRRSRDGEIVEGQMEIVEFSPPHAFGAVIHDGPVRMRLRLTVEPAGQEQSTLGVKVEVSPSAESIEPWPDEAELDAIKELIEAEAVGSGPASTGGCTAAPRAGRRWPRRDGARRSSPDEGGYFELSVDDAGKRSADPDRLGWYRQGLPTDCQDRHPDADQLLAEGNLKVSK
jgi:hypothetical protein